MRVASLINNDSNCGTNNVHKELSGFSSKWNIICTRYSNGKSVSLDLTLKKIFIFPISIIKAIKLLRSYDVLLVDGIVNFYLIYCLSFFLKKQKVYFIIHNDYASFNTRSRWKFVPNGFFTQLYDFILRRFNVVACSDYTSECLRLRGIKSKPINNGVALPSDFNECSKLHKLWFVGRLLPIKNVKLILESLAYCNHSNIELNIVGDGPEKQSLQELSTNYNLNVNFHGFVSEPFNNFRPGDIFLLPSIIEGRSIALMEAIVRNGYIICSDIAPNKVFEQQGAVTFELSNPSTLLYRLQEALELSPRERELRAISYKDEIALLSNKRMYLSYMELFSNE